MFLIHMMWIELDLILVQLNQFSVIQDRPTVLSLLYVKMLRFPLDVALHLIIDNN